MSDVDTPLAKARPNVLSDIHLSNPYPVYARLRETHPVLQTPAGWLVTRFNDCRYVLSQQEIFRAPGDQRQEAASVRVPVLSRVMSSQNPPRHTRMRTAVVRPFTERIRRMHPHITALCERFLDSVAERLLAGAVVDLAETAVAFPRDTILYLLGLPMSDRDQVTSLVNDIFPTSGPLPGPDNDATAAMRSLTTYLGAVVAERQGSGGDDLTSELTGIHLSDPAQLPYEDLISILTGLLVAGFPQIAAGITTGTVLLLRYPRHRELLRNPDTARKFVQEVLRWDTPVQFTPAPRITSRKVMLGDVEIPAGDRVWPALAAANRDPTVFAHPDEFNPKRDEARPLSFGGGAHYCVAAELVHSEIALMLRLLTRRLPNLALASPPVERFGRLRGFTSVPVYLRKD